VRVSVLRRVERPNTLSFIRVGLFNARSVSSKCASVEDWIIGWKLYVAALVDTWHDDGTSPDLLACAPPGFQLVEEARMRSDQLTLSANYGVVCLLYDESLCGRRIDLPEFSSFEVVCVSMQRAGFNAVIVVIYRTVSRSVTQLFYYDFTGLLERLSTLSVSLIIVVDLNIHYDVATNDDAGKLCDILSVQDLCRHVKALTHGQGYTLDLFITRHDPSIRLLPVDPPLLSDHLFVVADVRCTTLRRTSIG
jgi:dihydroneopterin aldolase